MNLQGVCQPINLQPADDQITSPRIAFTEIIRKVSHPVKEERCIVIPILKNGILRITLQLLQKKKIYVRTSGYWTVELLVIWSKTVHGLKK
ncbi:hypothetical protein AVEN_125100-1 [Araneus ventricosus]|uniref:Uncharacterized protein n=1 Tax=Araneus ventricosus TaxID=182803 RepID=A0A4Y2M2B8_ARAVE|nr:hypothetical protein AVEN_125100-1 [Araneus ventricosus]